MVVACCPPTAAGLHYPMLWQGENSEVKYCSLSHTTKHKVDCSEFLIPLMFFLCYDSEIGKASDEQVSNAIIPGIDLDNLQGSNANDFESGR